MLRSSALVLLGLLGCTDRPLTPCVHDFAVPVDLAVPIDLARMRADPCPAGSNFIFTIDQDSTLSRFNPPLLQFFDVGKIHCPAEQGAQPNSMAIDRDGNGWVNFDSGALYRVLTATAACSSTPYQLLQGGLTRFGMSFAEDMPGSAEETLWVADTAGGAGLPRLGPIDLMTYKLGSLVTLASGAEPELTGDDEGNLWGFFPADVPPRIARIDRMVGTLDRAIPLPALAGGMPLDWGVAAWQGSFYVFLARDVDTSTSVYHVDGSSGVVTPVLVDTGRRIVGVGVATCAGNGLD